MPLKFVAIFSSLGERNNANLTQGSNRTKEFFFPSVLPAVKFSIVHSFSWVHYLAKHPQEEDSRLGMLLVAPAIRIGFRIKFFRAFAIRCSRCSLSILLLLLLSLFI
ncbi:hypothetical protein CEXT_640331 [Caerostris extrusa]|uniref:Uncharacterized protein n=1 Tax=Caerostris extrusa TaxID=172846 RepID=A0AAV4VNL5_CAEEX|nr:hypothetical protein CEXT_640331 [Caerostris extrusa]